LNDDNCNTVHEISHIGDLLDASKENTDTVII